MFQIRILEDQVLVFQRQRVFFDKPRIKFHTRVVVYST